MKTKIEELKTQQRHLSVLMGRARTNEELEGYLKEMREVQVKIDELGGEFIKKRKFKAEVRLQNS